MLPQRHAMALLIVFLISFALYATLLEGDAKAQRQHHPRHRVRTIHGDLA